MLEINLKHVAACLTAALTLSGCSDENNPAATAGVDAQEQALSLIVADYVDHTVVPTYRGLADNAMKLAEVCDAMCAGGVEALTERQIAEAGRYWLEARRYWELSEAWLYGAADVYNIDPHIDTWPLDKAAMEAMLSNPAQMAQMSNRERAAEYVGSSLGQGLLGFHAIEYLIFEPRSTVTATTSARPASRFTQNQLYYLAAVADDLRNCCLRLEASWAPAGSVDPAKLAILDEAELSYTTNFGSYMKNAGQPGSIYVNYAEAVQELIVGAQDIADEVGNQKIGNPVGSGLASDPDYIESPYALNSITDFLDNIRSVSNAYMGHTPEPGRTEPYITTAPHPLSDYVAAVDPGLDTRMRGAIAAAMEAIGRMREPFAATSQDISMRDVNFAAVEACNELNSLMDELIELIHNN